MHLRRTLLYYLSFLIYSLARLLFLSLKVRAFYPEDYQNTQQYLAAFWHGKLFLPVFIAARHKTKMVTLVSPSRDGDVIIALLKKMGYEAVRGSSRKNSVAALSGLLKKVKEGYSIGIAVDGPLGPVYKVKPGIVHIAQKLKIAIIPTATAFQKKWIFKSWDRFELPKPFSSAVFYIGKPIEVPEEASIAEYCVLIEQAMLEANKAAEALLKEPELTGTVIPKVI